MRRKPWIKLWSAWFTTDSHAFLAPISLHVGPRLLTIAGASWDGETPHADLRTPRGEPLDVTQLAHLCRLDVQTMGDVMADLEAAGTIRAVRGCWRFDAFQSWQETPDAARKRRERAGLSRDKPRTVRGQSPDNPREGEGEAEGEAEGELPPVSPPAGDDRITRIWDHFNATRTGVIRGARSMKLTAEVRRLIRARLKDGHEVEDAIRVIDHAAGEVRADPKAAKWLNGVTVFRPQNFARRLGMADAPRVGGDGLAARVDDPDLETLFAEATERNLVRFADPDAPEAPF